MSKSPIIISGANGGLGKALCQKFMDEGYPIIGLVRSVDKKETLLNEWQRYNDLCRIEICDVTDLNACQKLVEKLVEVEIGGLINNAGITRIKTFDGVQDIEATRQVIETNLMGAIQLTGAFVEKLKASAGAIISISSVLGFAPVYGRTAYAASKFGMEGFFRTLGTELKSYGVYSLVVYPTFIATGIRTEDMNKKTTGETLTPEFCAEKIFFAFAHRKKRTLLLGKTAHQSYWIYKFFPKLYEKLMINKMKGKVDSSTEIGTKK